MQACSRDEIANLQAGFVEALRSPQSPVPQNVTAHEPLQLTRRFNVYRNTVHASLSAALAARFPVVERLVGPEFFQATVLCFIAEALPASPVLAHYGAGFAAFLAHFEPARELPYLADVARLEWARTVAYHAADAAVLGIGALQGIAAEQLGDVRLVIHPAAFAVASEFPIASIWSMNTHDAEPVPLDPDCGAEAALVTRPHLDVLVTPVPLGTVLLFEALERGATLGEAVAAAQAGDAAFAPADGLAQLFSAGAIAAPSSFGT